MTKKLDTPNATVWVGEADFIVGDEYQALCQQAPHAGAVVFFVGLVRDMYSDSAQYDHESVSFIELEHYPGMTERLCHDIIHQASQRFTIDAVRLLHRVGQLMSGDQIVMVAVASQHRDNAFQAGQFIMDHLKTRATLWKREVGSRGAEWLGVKAKDKTAVERWET